MGTHHCISFYKTSFPCSLAVNKAEGLEVANLMRPLWVLELDQAHAVVVRVDEPGHPGEADIGNAVVGLESWQVVVFDLHAAPAQFADLSAYVSDAEGR